MTGPISLHPVIRGIYDDCIVVAVFSDATEAQDFAEYKNLTDPPRNVDEGYRVEDGISFYRPGSWVRPEIPVDNVCRAHDFSDCPYC